MEKEQKQNIVTYKDVKDYFLNKNPYFTTKLNDVILIDNNAYIKEDIKNFMEEIKYKDSIRDYNLVLTRALWFSGEPGLGKTYLAKSISGELKIPLFILDTGEILKDSQGLDRINKIFQFVDNPANQPCILFMDECDGIAKSRENKNVSENTKVITNKIMQWLNEQNESKTSNLIVIAATNFASGVDFAFRTRFQLQEIFYLPNDYIPYIKIEVDKNNMFELREDVDSEDIKLMNINLRDAKLSIRELNARINIVFKQEIIKRNKEKTLDGTRIPIRLSTILTSLGRLKNFNPLIVPTDQQTDNKTLDEVVNQ